MTTSSDAPSTSEPAEDAVGQTNHKPLMVARGIGGRIELYHHAVRIVRHGYVNFLLTWLGGRPAFVSTEIAIDQISSFDIIEPVFFNDFVSISYPGSPPLTGNNLDDSLAENALMMGFFDNRKFHELRRRYQMIAGLTTADSPPSSLRRSLRWSRRREA
jgi:hypothetical protein